MCSLQITSCSCRTDHSVAAVFTANGIGREGVMGVHSMGEVRIALLLLLLSVDERFRLVTVW